MPGFSTVSDFPELEETLSRWIASPPETVARSTESIVSPVNHGRRLFLDKINDMLRSSQHADHTATS
jgi:hypothetical protein